MFLGKSVSLLLGGKKFSVKGGLGKKKRHLGALWLGPRD